MSEPLCILFCDNLKVRHDAFKKHVETELLSRLKKATSQYERAGSAHRDYELKFLYSQCRKGKCSLKGTKSVEEWIREGKKFSVVVTDMNFDGTPSYGSKFEGLHIIDDLSKPGYPPVWGTKFIVLTNLGSVLGYQPARDKFMTLRERGILPDWREEIAGKPPWDLIVESIYSCLGLIAGVRHSMREEQIPLYETILIREKSDPAPVAVIVKEKGAGGASLAFELEKDLRYTFWALAKAKSKFKTDRELAADASLLKLRAERETLISPFTVRNRETVLKAAGITPEQHPIELCNIKDDDLCEVAKGSRVLVGTQGYQCQATLDSMCVKTMLIKKVSEYKRLKKDLIRIHLRRIGWTIHRSAVPLKSSSPQQQALGHYHDAPQSPHRHDHLCGFCLIHNQRNKQGYSLSAEVTEKEIADDAVLTEAIRMVAGSDVRIVKLGSHTRPRSQG